MKTWHDETIPINNTAWIKGGTPESSSVIPWSIETIERSDIEHWQGTLAESVVDEAVAAMVQYVRSSSV